MTLYLPGTGPCDCSIANFPALISPDVVGPAVPCAGSNRIAPSGSGVPSSVTVPETATLGNVLTGIDESAEHPPSARAENKAAAAGRRPFERIDRMNPRPGKVREKERGRGPPGPAPTGHDRARSALMTSSPWLVPAAIHVRMLTEFLMNRTLPSHIEAFTPPE